MAKKRINSKTKGSSYEREIAKLFRELGFEHCKTSRQARRLLDDSKIDLALVPYNIQCKRGYAKAQPKYNEVFAEMTELLAKNFPKTDLQHNYPKILFHKIDGKKPENHVVSMPFNDFMIIFKGFLDFGKTLEKQLNK